LKCIALPTKESGLHLAATVGNTYEFHSSYSGKSGYIIQDDGSEHSFDAPSYRGETAIDNGWNTATYFELVSNVFQSVPQDVAKKAMYIGDQVAFCAAGRSSDMRVGKIIRFTKKQVEIEHEELQGKWVGSKWVKDVPTTVTSMRNFENVAKV
jgi:hypothetical protein